MTAHDKNLCGLKCTTREGGCSCPCKDCSKFREKAFRADRLEKLRARLEKANIDVNDLADLLWLCVEPYFENQIRNITTDELRSALESVSLNSTVKMSLKSSNPPRGKR